MRKTGFLTAIFVFVGSFGIVAAQTGDAVDVNDIAQSYVKLVLQIGLYDPEYVDSYFGPESWKPSDDNVPDIFPAESLRSEANTLIERLDRIDAGSLTEATKRRCTILGKFLIAVRAKIDLLDDVEMSFDDECKALYDVVAPTYDPNSFEETISQIDRLLDGDGDVVERFNRFRASYTVSQEHVRTALETAIGEYRKETITHLRLPAQEEYQMQFVSAKAWTASLSYKGAAVSTIQVNCDIPFGVVDVIHIAGHELYPGHHVYLSLQEEQLYKRLGWVEYCIWPLFGPRAPIAEGLAEYGCKDLAMSRDRQAALVREFMSAAGLDPNQAQKYCQLMALKDELDAAVVEGARRYLDGRMDRDKTLNWLERYNLTSLGGALSLLSFIDQYRSYIVNYSLGRDLVRRYIETHAGSDVAKQWQAFNTLLTTPRTASDLIE